MSSTFRSDGEGPEGHAAAPPAGRGSKGGVLVRAGSQSVLDSFCRRPSDGVPQQHAEEPWQDDSWAGGPGQCHCAWLEGSEGPSPGLTCSGA